MEFKRYHTDLTTLHIGCDEPRAYFIPFAKGDDLDGARECSSFFTSLCGEWNFNFYNSFEDIDEDFLEKDFSNTISVPKCWQVDLNKGYDAPLYSNLFYPFPINPPFVPQENPCGHYMRKFNIDIRKGKLYKLNFEGVSSCFYLFINGKFVAYSQVSHCTSEIDITKYIINGENRIDVLVVKWCDGSYLEDQDFFRLSGIFREVYILERDEYSIEDIEVKTQISDNLQMALVNLDIKKPLSHGDVIATYELRNENGDLISQGDAKDGIYIENPILWNTENPYLYSLNIICCDEIIPLKLALKKIVFRENVALFNGKPIKLFGINRHDNNPKTGYYVSYDDMIKDLSILKGANVNTIRTSHYPNDPRFMELCDKYGFMVVDEADIETHGMGFEYRDTWDWTRWSKLSTDDEWEISYVDRAKRLYERDKNFGCIIMWSLGNESGCGKNHRSMRNYIKMRNPNAIVHYENSHLEFKAVPIGENFTDISDVESRMYSSLDYTKKYAEYPQSKKPFFWCEYSCSMTTGDIHQHVNLIREQPAIWGGCYWEFADHAIEIAPGKFRYGGDFGDYPNNDVCCIDGVVFPDRTLRPGFADLKKAYQDFDIKYNDGILSVYNRRYFTQISDYYIEWKIESDGEIVKSGKFDNINIQPQDKCEFNIGSFKTTLPNSYLTVFVKHKKDSFGRDADTLAGFEQIDISEKSVQNNIRAKKSKKIEWSETNRYLIATVNKIEFVIDKPFGRVSSIKSNGKEILYAPISVETWKAFGYNQFGTANDRKSANLHYINQQTYSTIVEKSDNEVKVICKISLSGPAVVPIINGEIIYTINSNGLEICLNGEYRNLLKDMNLILPRLGLKVPVLKEYENIEYFGKGPTESYADRHIGTYYGKFTTSVTENFVPYIKPIENGSHFDTKNAFVFNKRNKGLTFNAVDNQGFGFNVTQYNPHKLENTAHNDELIPDEYNSVFIDFIADIRGGRGIYEEKEPERKFNFEPFEYKVSINVK